MVLYFDEGRKVRKMWHLTGYADSREGRDCFPDKDGFSKECARLLKKGGRLYIADPKLPLPIRKVLNTALDIHKINGRIYTTDEMNANFSEYGFKKAFDKSDAYAQIICLERI